MQKAHVFGIAVVLFIAGLGAGYVLGSTKNVPDMHHEMAGLHTMPDGTLMDEHGNTVHSEMSMEDMMKSMNAALEGKTGDAFDKAFLDEMIVHHEGAVEMALLARTNANHQEIKDLAEAIISAQNTEIEMMKMWRANWFAQ